MRRAVEIQSRYPASYRERLVCASGARRTRVLIAFGFHRFTAESGERLASESSRVYDGGMQITINILNADSDVPNDVNVVTDESPDPTPDHRPVGGVMSHETRGRLFAAFSRAFPNISDGDDRKRVARLALTREILGIDPDTTVSWSNDGVITERMAKRLIDTLNLIAVLNNI